MFPLQLCVDFITGQLGDTTQQKSVSHISRVIIAGNSLSQSTQDKKSLNKVCSYVNVCTLRFKYAVLGHASDSELVVC